jgi:hypothetical protein
MCEAFYLAPADTSLVESTESEDADESSGDEFYSPQSSPQVSPSQIRKAYSRPTQDTTREDSCCSSDRFLDINEADGIISQIVLLMGRGITYNPHVVHICPLDEGVHLVLMFEVTAYVALCFRRWLYRTQHASLCLLDYTELKT